MAFTRALYYPWIDIDNDGWLKNAMLYWENIYSIVPASLQQPYQAITAREFFDAGLLLPHEVDPLMPEIEGLTDDVLKYFETPQGKDVLSPKAFIVHDKIHVSKLPPDVRGLVEIHKSKLSSVIIEQLKHERSDEWVMVDKHFEEFYMTLLATRLSEKRGIGLLTDKPAFNDLVTRVKIDAPLMTPRSRYSKSRLGSDGRDNSTNVEPHALAQGLLANLVLSEMRINPDTPVKKILQFRTKYASELGRFRTSVAKLTESISQDQSVEQLCQQIYDVYLNEVRPSISSLEKGLVDSTIQWSLKNSINLSALSSGSVSLLNLLHLATPYTLLADAGFLLTVSAIQYNRERPDTLRQNPYSYILRADKHLSRKRIGIKRS